MHPAPPVPRAAVSPTTPARLVAWWTLAAAVLYVVGVYAPYLTISGTSTHISDGGSDSIIPFLIPAIVAAFGAVLTLVGTPAGSIFGAGAAGGAIGWGISLLTYTWWLAHDDPESTFGFDSDIGYGVGFFALAAAIAVAIVAMVAALTASRDAVKGAAPHPVFARLAALAFVGVPLSLLLAEDGVSNFDFPDDAVKASIIAWAVVAPLVGFAAALGGSRGGVVLALGIAVGHIGLVIALARNDFEISASDGIPVMREALYVAAVIAVIVLCALALALAPGALGSPSAPATEHAPTPAGIAAPPPVVDMSTTAVVGRWDEDPYGRHQLRWYDGHRWTDRVMDDMVERQDQPGWGAGDGPSLPS